MVERGFRKVVYEDVCHGVINCKNLQLKEKEKTPNFVVRDNAPHDNLHSRFSFSIKV